jgi:hypothetical protein
MPRWIRSRLASGLLTPLNKSAESVVDARPVRADDSDVNAWSKALMRDTVGVLSTHLLPEQLAVGVSDGVPMLIIGFKLEYEKAIIDNANYVIYALDVANAHNSYSPLVCQLNLSEMVQKDPALAPLQVGLFALQSATPAIFTRTSEQGTGFSYLCDNVRGGAQGNPLTGAAFCVTIDKAIKRVASEFPHEVTIKLIQDDIVIGGNPLLIDGPEGAKSKLLLYIGETGLSFNLAKFRALGTNQRSLLGKDPTTQETFFEYFDEMGVKQKTFGIEICKSPIGEQLFIEMWMEKKANELSSRISSTTNALISKDAHAASSVFNYSLSTRHDYISMTSLPSDTLPFRNKIDEALSSALTLITESDLLNPEGHNPGEMDPSFTHDRYCEKIRLGGGGFRPGNKRTQFLNCMNKVLPQLIDRKTTGSTIVPGLWNNLSNILGRHSFDPGREATRWSHFMASGSRFGVELRSEWMRLQSVEIDLRSRLRVPPPPSTLLSVPSVGFGASTKMLQKAIFDELAILSSTLLVQRAEALPKSDPRRWAFFAARDNPTTRVLLEGLPVPNMLLTTSEFRESFATLFGISSPSCAGDVTKRILNNPNSYQRTVDKHGFNLKTAGGVKGDHIRDFHDTIVQTLINSISQAGIPHTGGHQRPCVDLFSHLFHRDDERKYQGIIPDIVIRGNSHVAVGGGNILAGRESLCDVKTLAPGLAYRRASPIFKPVDDRERRVNLDYHKNAKALDVKFHGTPRDTMGPVQSALFQYGINGRVLGLVFGAFGECSKDVYILRDFIASCQGRYLTQYVDVSEGYALSVYRHKLNRLWGLAAARGWARVLLGRRRFIQGSVTSVPNMGMEYSSSGSYFNSASDAYADLCHEGLGGEWSSSFPRHRGE